jgi:hypothetical protein
MKCGKSVKKLPALQWDHPAFNNIPSLFSFLLVFFACLSSWIRIRPDSWSGSESQTKLNLDNQSGNPDLVRKTDLRVLFKFVLWCCNLMPVCMSDFISALKIICKKMHSFSIVLQICGTQSQPDLPVHMSEVRGEGWGGGGGNRPVADQRAGDGWRDFLQFSTPLFRSSGRH